MTTHYLKYLVPNQLIFEKLKTKPFTNINFYIDLMSISRGFFNKKVVLFEIDNYVSSGNYPTIFIDELKLFLSKLHRLYFNYNPKFVLFYDTGSENQNRLLSQTYKAESGRSDSLLDDQEMELFRKIKQYYLNEIDFKFHIPNVCKPIYLKNVETDYIPYFILDSKLIGSDQETTLNMILSVDKDLLQCCQFKNTYQAVSVYLKTEGRIDSHLYDDIDALKYIYKNFKPGYLTSKYIPLFLALAGDKADGIPNLYKGLGHVAAINLIEKYDLPPVFNSSYILPDCLSQYKSQLLQNLNLISFELQMKRIPFNVHLEVKNKLNAM
jgi:hypothetical protein